MIKSILLKLFLGFLTIFILLIIGIMAFINLSPQFGAAPAGKHLEIINRSQNYNGKKFINLIPTSMNLDFKNGTKVMYSWIFEAKDREPAKPLPVQFADPYDDLKDSVSSILTWYGHSAISLEIDGKFILIDPMLGKAASPVPFMTKRFEYDKAIDLESIPKVDAVILSHDHYDHLDYPSIMKLKDKVGHFFTPLGVGSHLVKWGVERSKITELDWWESAEFEHLKFVATPARHFSGRGISDRNKTQWASWVIQGQHENIYFSGDSGYGPHFKQIGDKYGPFDFAMMECGQYNQNWEAIHMLPEQTIQASIDVNAKLMMPIHWSAFNLSLHSWTDPVERALKAAESQDVNIFTPLIGQRFSPGKATKSTTWWRNL